LNEKLKKPLRKREKKLGSRERKRKPLRKGSSPGAKGELGSPQPETIGRGGREKKKKDHKKTKHG